MTEFSLNSPKAQRTLIILLVLIALIGGMFRLYHITRSDFVFYDEGFYLNHNRKLGELLAQQYPAKFSQLSKAVSVFFNICLASGKSLWFMVVDSRIFLGKVGAWYFARIASAVSGLLTLFLLFRFARRYFDSSWTAWLSVALLAVLPSHVFYSRIGMQEAFSTLLVLLGFYFYIFPKKFGWRTFLAGFIMAAAFFANYRLIILPALVLFCEFYISLAVHKTPSFRKYLWFVLTFFFFVFTIGNIDNGRNTTIIFAWIFHQAQFAERQFDWFNLFSYPYYLFRLENWFFGALFLGNIYYLIKKKWWSLFPFLLVCCQMVIFSFAGEKGARYLCIMTPFMAMAVANMMVMAFRERDDEAFKYVVLAVGVIMFSGMMKKSFEVAKVQSDYRPAIEYLRAENPKVKVVSTQSWVQNLYVANPDDVKECPQSFSQLLQLFSEQYEYIIIGPQAYISWTKENERFSTDLKGYLGFVSQRAPPVKTFPHFNDTMLERFVFEHSENLRRSIDFLDQAKDADYGALKIYPMNSTVGNILKILSTQNTKK